MVRTPDTADVTRAGRGARDVAHSTPVRIAARVGIAANDVLHLLIGWLAVQIALGSGGQADQNGALGAIAAEPLGRAFLWVLVVGFAAVVLWRSVSAVWGFGYLGDRKKQLAKRLVSAGLGGVYLVLAVAAAPRRSAGGRRRAVVDRPPPGCSACPAGRASPRSSGSAS